MIHERITPPSRRLTRAFFARPCAEIAPDLLGCHLVHDFDDGRRISGIIIEVEAYLGDGSDPAPTPIGARPAATRRCSVRRVASTFTAAWAFTCAPMSSANRRAVARPYCCVRSNRGEGLEVMRRNRPGRTERDLTNGPAKLTQAFGIRLEHDRDSVLRGSLRVEAGHARPAKIARSPRIGLTTGADLWQRFFVVDNCWVTPSPINRRARRIRPILGGLWVCQTRAAR